MTPKKVFEIAKRVYDAYPVTGKEKRGCCTAIAKNEGLRFARVKRLVEEEREKVEDGGIVSEGKENTNEVDETVVSIKEMAELFRPWFK